MYILRYTHWKVTCEMTPRNDVWETSAEIPCWCRSTTQIRIVLRIRWKVPFINEKHHSDLGSNTSSVWNFCICSLHVISRRNQRWQTRTQSLFNFFGGGERRLGIRWRRTSLPMRPRARLNLIPIFSHPKKHLNMTAKCVFSPWRRAAQLLANLSPWRRAAQLLANFFPWRRAAQLLAKFFPCP